MRNLSERPTIHTRTTRLSLNIHFVGWQLAHPPCCYAHPPCFYLPFLHCTSSSPCQTLFGGSVHVYKPQCISILLHTSLSIFLSFTVRYSSRPHLCLNPSQPKGCPPFLPCTSSSPCQTLFGGSIHVYEPRCISILAS